MQRIFSGWNFMRFLRLGIGIYFAVQTVATLEMFSGFIAVFFLYQAISNTGCCGTSGCAVPNAKNNVDTPEEVELIEVESYEPKTK